MPTATLLLQPTSHYKRESFARGLERLGYAVAANNRNPTPSDIAVLWNRKAPWATSAQAHEKAGARVVITENGYIGKTAEGKLYALALGQHNGAGSWPVGGRERWESFGIELKPWRETGSQIVVLPQRGIGPIGVAMPPGWLASAHSRLQKATKRPILLRRHPGAAKTEPFEALQGAHAAVTWGSGAAIKALSVGIPVFFEFPRWIGADAARFGLDDLEAPFLGDREPMFERLAWAQWSLAEIESGEAFKWLLQTGTPAPTAASPQP